MPGTLRSGDLLADRYVVADLLSESSGGRFWRAHDRLLDRPVAVHIIDSGDPRAPALLAAARRSARVHDRHNLRVLDAEHNDRLCYVVNEWGDGDSLDILIGEEPMEPRRAAWIVSEVADALCSAHAQGVTHDRLVPENVLLERGGGVRLIGLGVDAALYGFPAGNVAGDVRALGALVYACLTGRWAGDRASVLEEAPRQGGRLLRPRQVRAGVPRFLDELCDTVLEPEVSHARARFDLTRAEGVRDALREFVGDPAALADAEAAQGHHRRHFNAHDPGHPGHAGHAGQPPGAHRASEPGPGGSATIANPVADPVADPLTGSDPGVDTGVDTDPERTQPTPFEQPADRPLFAPEPPPGEPVRKPRPGSNAASGSTYWPWDPGPLQVGGNTTGSGSGAAPGSGAASTSGSGSGGGRGTGSGRLRPVGEEEAEPEVVPGRNWMRLAIVVAFSTLVILACWIGYFLLNRVPVTVPGGDSGSSAAPAPSSEPLTGLTAEDFDPESTDPAPEENRDQVPLALDGDPETGWTTVTYTDQFGTEPPSLKSGVGLVVDLGGSRTVTGVDLTFAGAPTSYSVFVTDTPPARVTDLRPVVRQRVRGERSSAEFPGPVSGRFVTIWLTELPAADGGYRGEIRELSILAEPGAG